MNTTIAALPHLLVLFGAAALLCFPYFAKEQSADERLRAIYTEEWKWRLDQFPRLEGVTKPMPNRLPKIDPARQEMRLRYWQDVLHKLDDVPRAQLSPEEQINCDVYRPEIENFVADLIAELACDSDPTAHFAFIKQIRLTEFRREVSLFA
jgi:uncharacterized protein (DUF885 family)